MIFTLSPAFTSDSIDAFFLFILIFGFFPISPLNEDIVAPGTQEKVEEARKKIVEDGFNVFDGVLETNDGKTVGEEGKTLDDATITGGINWYYKNIVVK